MSFTQSLNFHNTLLQYHIPNLGDGVCRALEIALSSIVQVKRQGRHGRRSLLSCIDEYQSLVMSHHPAAFRHINRGQNVVPYRKMDRFSHQSHLHMPDSNANIYSLKVFVSKDQGFTVA